jgi:hypothetical protein
MAGLQLRIRDIDFPEDLLEAERDANLAIFAGAGVSIPPPSNYPDFVGLAENIAAGVLTRGEKEPIDRFLGRLHDKGTNVHSLVASLLTNPDSQPTSLHFDLLKLFRTSEALRLVTTNFDAHFTTAAASVFGSLSPIEIYDAPALPLGNSFNGLVYLHGSVGKAPQRLVLTDRDFGRAYLTDGWARIFLQKLFSRYNVLFVGYSHNDIVMNYLARGLPPESGAPQRFALAPSGEEERWISLGITPITYEYSQAQNAHSGVVESISAWAIQARQGALDQEQRIRSIVELPPPLDEEASDYIRASLKSSDTTRFFTRHAKLVEWLKWTEDKGCLKNIFREEAALTEVDRELARWFADQFVLSHPGETLAVMQRNAQTLHWITWTFIAHRLFRKENGQRVAAEVLRRWVPVLLNSSSRGSREDLLPYVLNDLREPEVRDTAILIFEYLTRPILKLEKNRWTENGEKSDGGDVSLEVTTIGDQYWLDHAWKGVLSPQLAAVADMLEVVVTAHLQRAFLLFRSDRNPGDTFDRLGSRRGQIEDSSQGGPHDGLGVLIDIGYALMQWNNAHRTDRADALISQWFSSDSIILKRLAIVGAAENTHWTADRKLSWILEQNLLYKYGTKHEVFKLLGNAYPTASHSVQRAILEGAKSGGVAGIPEEVMKYERYNVINWLRDAAPDSDLTKTEFDSMQQTHPEFRKRDRPDLDVVFNSWTTTSGSESPFTVEALLGKAPSSQVDEMLEFKSTSPFGPSRNGLLDAVRSAAAKEFKWGLDLAQELASRSLWGVDLWSAIVQAWSSVSLSSNEWNDALGFLVANRESFSGIKREIANLLSEGAKEGPKSIPDGLLDQAMQLSRLLWLACKQEAEPKKPVNVPDWLMRAINDPAGMLALFWVHTLANRRKEAADKWQGIQGDLKNFFEDLLSGDTYSDSMVRVIFASQLTFFFASDEVWTKQHLLPIFDWQQKGDSAIQALQGFLAWGRQTDALLPQLLPLYLKVFPHMAELGKSRDRFNEYLAGAACFSSINPLQSGWLREFLLKTELLDRLSLARSISNMLRGMQDDARKAVWDNWMCQYWEGRVNGVPVTFEVEELGVMVEWTPFLGPAFPGAVQLIRESPKFKLNNSFVYRELDESEIPHKYPADTAKLLIVLLSNETTQSALHDLDSVDKVVRKIVPLGAFEPSLLAVCDHLAHLGYPAAGALREFVKAEYAER